MPAAAAHAVSFEVTTRNDRFAEECPVGDCSLREAVHAANFTPGTDRIVLPSRKRYQLSAMDSGFDYTSGDLDVLKDPLKVVHPGPGHATIDFNPAGDGLPDPLDRIFEVHPDAPLTLEKVRLTDGGDPSGSPDGGAIRALDDVTLKHSAVVGNEAPGNGGGIFTVAGASLTVSNSVVARNVALRGGGIEHSTEGSPGVLVIRRSTISGNQALGGDGGGIYVDTLANTIASITDSTVADNRATGFGGGLFARSAELEVTDSTFSENRAGASGGGMAIWGPQFSWLRNSTVAGNRANWSGGGIVVSDSQVSMNAVTVARNHAESEGLVPNGGGVFAYGSSNVVATNSLFALNTTRFDGVLIKNDCEGEAPFQSRGHNLLSTKKLCSGFDRAGDRINARPGIGPLRPNGGATETIALAVQSPAIDRADASDAPESDQRGRRRHDPDIGAFERTPSDS